MSQCPHARFAQLRRESPVSEVRPGLWAVSRLDDVKQVLQDPATYSAKVMQGSDFELFGPSPVRDEIDAIMAEYPERPVLMRTDPPEHARVRNVVARVLTPSEVAKFEPAIRAAVDELIDAWLPQGAVEFYSGFAARLPNMVSTDFICGDPGMRDTFRFWAGETMSRIDAPQSPERQLEVARALAAMARYFVEAIAERRLRPSGDLISLIANATTEDGAPLADVEIVNVLQTFMVGGNETTAFLLGNAMIALAEDPGLLRQLQDDRARVPVFVEEMLRLSSPAQSAWRVTTRAAELGGATIPAGAMVMAFMASANRDEAAFADADRIDLARPAMPRHIAFGYGQHSCLGLQLARAEARIAIDRLVERLDTIALVPGSVEWVSNDMLRGPVKLDLTFTAA